MRAAPPAVELALGSGLAERLVVAALYGLAADVLMAWWLLRGQAFDGLFVVWLAGAAASGAVFGWRVLKPAQGRLCWDGAGWCLRPLDRAGPIGPDLPLRAVQLQCDLGNWLLLRALRDGQRPAMWCGVSARQAGPAWHGLRLALYHGMPVPARGER